METSDAQKMDWETVLLAFNRDTYEDTTWTAGGGGAWDCRIIDGSLVFMDKEGRILEAIAPGYWKRVRLIGPADEESRNQRMNEFVAELDRKQKRKQEEEEYYRAKSS